MFLACFWDVLGICLECFGNVFGMALECLGNDLHAFEGSVCSMSTNISGRNVLDSFFGMCADMLLEDFRIFLAFVGIHFGLVQILFFPNQLGCKGSSSFLQAEYVSIRPRIGRLAGGPVVARTGFTVKPMAFQIFRTLCL